MKAMNALVPAYNTEKLCLDVSAKCVKQCLLSSQNYPITCETEA